VSEQDPEAWWVALTEALRQVGGHLASVVAISVAGQQHGLVLVDHEGRSLRPAKLWNDTTSAPQAAALRSRLGDTQVGTTVRSGAGRQLHHHQAGLAPANTNRRPSPPSTG
jgi:xylulokinase